MLKSLLLTAGTKCLHWIKLANLCFAKYIVYFLSIEDSNVIFLKKIILVGQNDRLRETFWKLLTLLLKIENKLHFGNKNYRELENEQH